MKIAVGTLNPVKIAAVTSMFQRVWPEAEIIPVAVPSGVSAMPMTDAETIAGARNRAIAARAALDADFGVGLEGGVHPEPFGLALQGWVAVVNGDGREGIGGAARIPLPEHIAQRVRRGEELGRVMDDVLGDHNTKQKGGAVGALTNGLVMRQETFALAVAYALAPFISPQLYNQPRILQETPRRGAAPANE
ncbi:MAG TPA: inosine/xanthosine triphosphatase [Anaerolineae bacterium]|nr:inosine/xanthosine triphosphatase [Anaerolineae bacterium]HIP69807.1 inosine/xanthosine triphosphatase [Anaerolineae bacterium]